MPHTSEAPDAQFQVAADIMRRQAGGLYGVTVVRRDRPSSRPPDPFTLVMAERYLKAMAAGEVCRCMFCQRKLDTHCTDAFVIFAAGVPFHSASVTAAVCDECVVGRTDEQLAFAIRDNIAPGSDAQIVQAATVSAKVGHA